MYLLMATSTCNCNYSHLQGVQRTKHVGKDISPSQTSTDGEVEQLRQRYLSRRQAFVIGINEVTRLLEKDQLSLVLVNRGVKPLLLVEHLLPLACRQHCFAVAMNNLCERVGPLVGVKTVSAIGFKVCTVDWSVRNSRIDVDFLVSEYTFN